MAIIMKSLYLAIISLICAVAVLAGSVSAAPADITVTSSSIDPPVLMKGDTGTLTVTIQNNGASPVLIKSARLFASGIVPLNDPYLSVGEIGAGNTKTFTFTVRADAGEGTFYPAFVIDFVNAGSLRYPVPIRVEDTPLSISVIKKPDAFSPGRTVDVTIRVGNPRLNAASGVQVIPQGPGISVTPSSAFIGALVTDGSGTVVFNLTPAEETTATFRVVWRNGINTHTTDFILPIAFGKDKRQADPIVTNVEIRSEAGGYRIAGDVMNAGLESARSVLVTPGMPAKPIDPYRVYAIGTLDPDDASPFEVTFQTDSGTTEVPIIIEYRDDNGNRYTATTMIGVGDALAVSPEGKTDGLPLVGIIVIVIVALGVAGAIYYSWRRK